MKQNGFNSLFKPNPGEAGEIGPSMKGWFVEEAFFGPLKVLRDVWVGTTETFSENGDVPKPLLIATMAVQVPVVLVYFLTIAAFYRVMFFVAVPCMILCGKFSYTRIEK